MIFQCPAVIQGIKTLVDRGLKFSVNTSELPAEQKTILFDLEGKSGWFLFKENALKEEDIKDLPDVKLEKDEKSPGQRLRGVIYRIWEQNGKTGTFTLYYEMYMEKIINQLKDRLQ